MKTHRMTPTDLEWLTLSKIYLIPTLALNGTSQLVWMLPEGPLALGPGRCRWRIKHIKTERSIHLSTCFHSFLTFFPSALRLPASLLSKSYPSISAEAHTCILSSVTMLRSLGFKKWTSLPTSKHSPTSLFHSPNDAAAPFLPLSGCLRSTDRMDSGSVFIGSVFSTACSCAPLRGWGMGEKHSAEGGDGRLGVAVGRMREKAT